MEKVVTSEKVFVGGDFNGHIGGDFNGHVGSDMGGFEEVHGVFGVGQINDGGIWLLDWVVGKGLHLMNMFPEKKKLVCNI